MPDRARIQRMLRPSLRTSVPFLVCAAVGLLTLALPPYETRAWQWAVAVPVILVALAAHAVTLRRERRTWVDPVAPYLCFVLVAVLRDAGGGATSGVTPMLGLPVLWLAVYGVRRDLYVAAALTCVTFVAPVLLVGGPAYPASDWRRAAAWTAVAVIVVPVIQRIVAAWQCEVDRQRETTAELDGVLQGARLSSIVTTDLAGVITRFGVGAEGLLGYRADELVGRATLELWHDADEVVAAAAELGVEPGFEVFRRLAAQEAPSRIWTFVRADGARIWCRLAMTELRDADGATTGYLGVAIDATENIRAQRAALEAEQRWRVLLDHLPDTTVMLIDEDLTVDVVTGAGGRGHARPSGLPLRDLVPAADADVLEAMARSALRGEQTVVELLSGRAGAEHGEHEVVMTPLPAQSRPQALLLGRDVSRERARERELLAEKERAERMFNDAPHGIVLLSLDGTVVQVNPALCRLLERAPAEMLGRGLSSLSDNPLDRSVARHLHDVLERGAQQTATEWIARTPEGRRVYVTMSSTVLHFADGEDQILVNLTDVSDRHGMEERLAHLADHDPLTGLANRRRFDAELRRHLDYCRRYGPIGAVLVLDLDNFKEVNDTLGHAAGDELIVSVAGVLLRGVRGSDIVARLGGDEFAVLLPQADRMGAEIVAQGITERVRNHVRALGDTVRKVTASVGVVVIDAVNEDPGELMAAADMVMYDAKDNGRDGYEILDYADYRQPRTGARMEWQTRIDQALEQDRFTLYLQPILDLATDTVTGAEALLRLVDGDRVVPPADFLPVAERTDQIVEIDCWVVDHAIALLRDLRVLDPDFRLEVNVSGRSMGHPSFERAVLDALDRHGVAADGLVLEVTETSAVADVETARDFAERMARVGCEFALDDFGAGFGSFYYLKHLRFDYVKIDGEFVANAHRDPADRLIVSSIVGIASGLGKRTVAEFVGDPEVLEVVRAEGVDYAQGYHVGPPMPVAELLPLLGARPVPDRTPQVSR